MTPFQKHKEKWDNCQRCPLAERRQHVCHFRGKLPCDVLFVGEAPGPSEDVIGRPFVGPAGNLLDHIVSEAFGGPGEIHHGVRIAFVNLVGCIPLDDDSEKFAEPPEIAIKRCSPKLRELVAMAKPKLIVCVGKLAAKWVRQQRVQLGVGDVKLVDIQHPAFILRSNIASRSLLVKKCVVVLADALEELLSCR